MRYDRARKNLDRHPNYILAAYMPPAPDGDRLLWPEPGETPGIADGRAPYWAISIKPGPVPPVSRINIVQLNYPISALTKTSRRNATFGSVTWFTGERRQNTALCATGLLSHLGVRLLIG